MFKLNMETIEGNFDNSEVNELLLYHFKELRSVSVSYTHLTLPTICSV